MKSHVSGWPRIGAQREWKFALESFWKGKSSESDLAAARTAVKAEGRRSQKEAGLDWITVGDFADYDPMLTAWMRLTKFPGLTEQFRLARGDASSRPWDMTKWFDTNYHYLVPELDASTPWSGDASELKADIAEATAQGHPMSQIKAALIGPITFLALSRWSGTGSVWQILPQVLAAFDCLLAALAAEGISWVQVEEPILALDPSTEIEAALRAAYGQRRGERPQILLAVPYGSASDYSKTLNALAIDGVHLDLVRGAGQLRDWKVPAWWTISLGLIDGRNVWASDAQRLAGALEGWDRREATWVGTSCSLQHVPLDASRETQLPVVLRSRLSFAVQKAAEVAALAKNQNWTADKAVTKAAAWEPAEVRRSPLGTQRVAAQIERWKLPSWPTTTIGSFPQTAEVRSWRASWKAGHLSQAQYETNLENEIARCVRWQDEIGLDVIVHGEFERTDMVEYFGEQLDGFSFTQWGWVQSYGSRCVKPPILHSDVSRRAPMTVRWAAHAQKQTSKPVKGMLTGPVTILQWSFVRDDMARAAVADQVARALSAEVLDLEAAGIGIIQVDEPALREGLPLRKSDHKAYWQWAVNSFHRTVAGVRPETQIHTHMCYSDFSTCLPEIASLDADVITIETSRSAMALLDDFQRFAYPLAVGPGVWDIHSPRVPSTDEMVGLLKRAAEVLPAAQLWANPDCGLKTRTWDEVTPSLKNLVEAAHLLRKG